jgi:hypothetical protein
MPVKRVNKSLAKAFNVEGRGLKKVKEPKEIYRVGAK